MSFCSECLDRGYDMCFCPPSPTRKTIESKIEILERINMKDKAEIDPHSKCMLDEIEYKKEIESLKKAVKFENKIFNDQRKMNGEFLEYEKEYVEKIESLKKDIEELNFDKNHLLELGDLRKVENQKLRELVKRAIELEGITFPDKKNQWLKDAEEILK